MGIHHLQIQSVGHQKDLASQDSCEAIFSPGSEGTVKDDTAIQELLWVPRETSYSLSQVQEQC